jgi:anti-anti-sigma factor
MEVTLEIGKQFPEITGAASDAFAAELMKAEDSEFNRVILDFDGTQTISSMAMGSIFATHQKMAEQERALTIINASDKIKRLLRMVNMAHLIAEEKAGQGGEGVDQGHKA